MKKIPTAAAGYAVKMGIKTFCPSCETIMTDLERVANEINSMMLDQCALSKSLGSGLVSKLNASSQQKCMMQSNITSGTRDMYENMEECNKNSEKYGTSGEDQMKSTLGNEFNLAWKALSKNGSDTTNSDLLEVICYDVVSNYLTSLLLSTQKEIKALELGSNEPNVINDFYSSIEDTRRVINSHKMTAYSRATIILQGKEQMTQKMGLIRNRWSRSLVTYK